MIVISFISYRQEILTYRYIPGMKLVTIFQKLSMSKYQFIFCHLIIARINFLQ